MSETVHYKGKLTHKIAMPEKFDTWEKQALWLRDDRGFTLDQLDLEEKEFWLNESNVYHHKGSWYNFEKVEHDVDEEIIHAENIGEEVHFQLKFYNGGACLEECLDEAMDKLKGISE